MKQLCQVKPVRLVTIMSGQFYAGIAVQAHYLKTAGKFVPAVMLGQEGGNTALSIVTVDLTQTPFLQAEWDLKREVIVQYAKLGMTQSGRHKLIAANYGEDAQIIAQFKTKLGYLGGNSHDGDWYYQKQVSSKTRPGETEGEDLYQAFPGTILAQGKISEGTPGHSASGDEILAVVDQDVWFSTGYWGYLNGDVPRHFYKWSNGQLMVMTWGERLLTGNVTDDQAEQWKLVQNFLDHRIQPSEVPVSDPLSGEMVTIPMSMFQRLIAASNGSMIAVEARIYLQKQETK